MMIYEDLRDFSFDRLKVGDMVSDSIIEHFSNQQMPALMWSSCYQLGGAVDHRTAPDGKLKATFHTFRQSLHLADSNAPVMWQYCGVCFPRSNRNLDTN